MGKERNSITCDVSVSSGNADMLLTQHIYHQIISNPCPIQFTAAKPCIGSSARKAALNSIERLSEQKKTSTENTLPYFVPCSIPKEHLEEESQRQ